MKNLLIYTGPQKKISDEDEILLKIQIDNSLDLGWKRENLLLVTDFEYEYNGLRSFVIEEDTYYPFDLRAGKIPALVYLLNHNLIEDKEIYWCHDLDAFENYLINEEELGLKNYDLGLTHYTYKPEWQCSSFFFKQSARDIIYILDTTTRKRPHPSRNNEKTLTWLIKHNMINPSRYEKLNNTYNFTKRYIPTIYAQSDKPIKVLHFRPSDKDALMNDNALDMFMYGKNGLKIPLMSDRLIKIFKKNGIK